MDLQQMKADEVREKLLTVMERKNHWAWPYFAEGKVPLPRLLAHFQQEWAVYVRDFPVFLARILGHGPPDSVRSALASNLYEEQTGGISGTSAHPDLFIKMMGGCGFEPAAFESVVLLPAAQRYRDFLDRVSWNKPWVVGAAVLTLFVEGSAREREELRAPPNDITPEQLEDVVAKHPLVRFHDVDPSSMDLVRAHQLVEGGHRRDAWQMMLENASNDTNSLVFLAMEDALGLWLAYRDEVAAACGLSRE
jgi:Iron-containing redox enzyme